MSEASPDVRNMIAESAVTADQKAMKAVMARALVEYPTNLPPPPPGLMPRMVGSGTELERPSRCGRPRSELEFFLGIPPPPLEARGSVSVGFWGDVNAVFFGGRGSSQRAVSPPPPPPAPKLKARLHLANAHLADTGYGA